MLDLLFQADRWWTVGTGTWGRKGKGSWTGVSSAKPARPVLSATRPARHADSRFPVARDDAPPDPGTPDFLVSRSEWLAHGGGGPADRSDPGGHGAAGGHGRVTSDVDRDGAADQLGFAHEMRGGHYAGEIPSGAGGPAKAGLRGDNSLPAFNPNGFRLGTGYLPAAMQRAMGTGRMRGSLRAIGQWEPETGDTASPPPPPSDRTSRTSPFDPSAPRRGFGPEQVTSRHILRPAGDEDTPPAPAVGGTLGDGLML